MSDSGEDITIVFSADEVVAMPLAAAIVSAFAAAARPEALRVFVLDGGLSARSRARIADAAAPWRGRVEWRPLRIEQIGRLSRLYVGSSRDYPPSAYARLLIGELLPDDVGKAIYLDADVIVRADLADLWAIPMNGALALAIADMPFENGCLARIRSTATETERRRLRDDQIYFQSGVMVFDIAGFRRERVAEHAFDCLARHPSLTFPDQDALNIVLADRHRLIDPRWNQMTAAFAQDALSGAPPGFDAATLRKVREDPFVVHFSGRPKPWEPGCAHPFRDVWHEAQARTPWADWRPTPLRRFVAWLPRARRLVLKRLRRRLAPAR